MVFRNLLEGGEFAVIRGSTALKLVDLIFRRFSGLIQGKTVIPRKPALWNESKLISRKECEPLLAQTSCWLYSIWTTALDGLVETHFLWFAKQPFRNCHEIKFLLYRAVTVPWAPFALGTWKHGSDSLSGGTGRWMRRSSGRTPIPEP